MYAKCVCESYVNNWAKKQASHVHSLSATIAPHIVKMNIYYYEVHTQLPYSLGKWNVAASTIC